MTEKELHQKIRTLLDHHDIVYFESRMDKKTTQRKGVPDFLFAVDPGNSGSLAYPFNAGDVTIPERHTSMINLGAACAWECKTETGKLSEEQRAMLTKMNFSPPNCWRTAVIRTVQ